MARIEASMTHIDPQMPCKEAQMTRGGPQMPCIEASMTHIDPPMVRIEASMTHIDTGCAALASPLAAHPEPSARGDGAGAGGELRPRSGRRTANGPRGHPSIRESRGARNYSRCAAENPAISFLSAPRAGAPILRARDDPGTDRFPPHGCRCRRR
ncbi:MAG TPA: hypothetical protein PK144_14740 [Plasticicumulans sp.]|nr:hypothetical protein [Plasticicumulans sp.]